MYFDILKLIQCDVSDVCFFNVYSTLYTYLHVKAQLRLCKLVPSQLLIPDFYVFFLLFGRIPIWDTNLLRKRFSFYAFSLFISPSSSSSSSWFIALGILPFGKEISSLGSPIKIKWNAVAGFSYKAKTCLILEQESFAYQHSASQSSPMFLEHRYTCSDSLNKAFSNFISYTTKPFILLIKCMSSLIPLTLILSLNKEM